MKKRIISLILALTLCVGMLPAPAWAEEAPTNQTLAETPVSQNEEPQEPQPEPAPQNEEGQEPQPIAQNQEGQEPQQGPAPQNGEAGEPQPEPAPQNGEGQEPQGAPEQMQPQGEPEQGEPQGEPEQGEPQGEPEQGEPQEEPEQEEQPVQSVLKANAPMAVAEGENGEEVTLTVGEQNGKLFDGVNSAATFPVTCENGNLNSLKITFSPENSDLTAEVSEDGTTVTVMTAGNAKAGIYQMTLALGQTSQTVSVIVDVPFTIKNKEIQVASDQTSATLTLEVDVAPELEGQVQYTWMPDGKNSVVTNTNTVTLYPDNLKQDETSPGRYSAWVDCRVSCGTYFGTATRKFVKIIACDHSGAILYTKEGTCRGCGQLCPEDRPFITEDGVAIQIAQNANTPFALDDYFPGTLYLWENYTRGTALHVGTLNGDGTLELQNHDVYSTLVLNAFQNNSFTIQNGRLTHLTLFQAGSLILENVTIENSLTVPAGMDLKLNNVTFKDRVIFWGTASINGGTFEAGLCNNDGTCLDILAPGYAFAREDRTVIDASGDGITGTVQVVPHTCTYEESKAGKCACGRSCPHESLNEGRCTVCKTLVEPFAIEGKGYRSLEAAIEEAQDGQTIYVRGDYTLPNPVEISKNITLDMNFHYTLSGSSENPLLRITGTDVTVQNGAISNDSGPAVTVASGAKLTVKTVTFGVRPDNVLVVEQGGHVDVQNGAFYNGVLYVNGSLSMKSGRDVKLVLGPDVENISIVEGEFNSITLAGGKEYKDLLAEGSAYWADGAWVKLEEAQEKAPTYISKCPHQDGLAGSQACPYCDKTCGHGNIDQATGFCKDCGYQVYKAKVDETMKSTFQEAMDAAHAGQTVTLLADDSLDRDLTLNKAITLNINGYTLNTGTFTVQAPLTICGGGIIHSAFYIHKSVTVQETTLQADKGWVKEGGSLCIEQGATVTLVSVFPGGSLELKQGTIGRLYVENGGKASLSSGTVTQNLEVQGGNLLSILAEGKALLLKADGTVIDGTRSAALGNMEIVDHTHTFGEGGKCACGAAASAQVVAGTESFYFVDFESAVNKAMTLSGSTVRLLKDVTHSGDSSIYIEGGTFTIDWNGHTLSGSPSYYDLMVITDSANVTLRDGSNTNTGGARHTGLGAAVSIAVRSGSVNIQGGTYSPNVRRAERCYGSVRISGGVFENPEDHGRNCALYNASGTLADLLAPGYTFAYEDDDSLFDVYHQNKSEIYRSVYVVAHQQHDFDEDGLCSCGYPCPHAEVDEEGECTLCGKRFYVQGTYANGTTHYYGTISDALEDTAVTQAKILRALTEECESWNGGDRSVTLDLNGWNLVVESIQGGHLTLRDSSGIGSILAVKEIQKDGQVSVESGRLAPQGETLSVYGKLTVTGGKVDSLTAMEGSTVSLSGGSFGKIVGSGVTLRSLLAEDRYYAELDGETPRKYADTDTVIEGVSVKLCDHTSVLENKQGYFPVYTCNCGKVRYLLTVTDGSGSVTYHSDYSEGFAYAAKCSGVVRLLNALPNGQTITMDAQGTVAIDMSGRSMNGKADLIIADGTTLKIVSDGSDGWDSNFPAESITVQSGGKFILPAKGPSGGDNKLKITGAVTVEAGAQAELSGGYCQVNLWGEARISGGKYGTIDVRGTENVLTVTGGEIGQLNLWGGIQNVQLSGGSVERLWVSEMDPDTSINYRTVTFEDIQSLLADGKAFRKADNTWLTEGDVEEYTPIPGGGTVKKLSDVTIADVPMTGAAVYCQLGAHTYEETVSTQYNVGEMDSSGNVVFRLGVRLQPQEIQSGVTVQWYQLGAEDSRTPVGTGLTCPLDPELPVGTHRFLAVVNCSGYVLESQPFAVTITPRVVNITGGFTAQDRDYAPDNPSVRIIQGEVTFDKKAEGDDLGAQVHGGTIATPDAGQNRTVAYSATLTGEDKDNYTLGSVPELTVTIRPIAQTLAFAEAAVTKTYGDSPFVNALDHSAGDGKITYTSSDPAVATVGTDGTVTIRGAGEARITATAAATQNYVETATSFDLTVDKATGTVRNRNYSLGYLYGDDIPTPERKYFEASSTGAFRYSWSPAAPKNAGYYQLTVTVDEDGNYTSATLVLDVRVEKDVWVRPTLVKAENETIGGKKDGKVTYTDTPALEYRLKRTRGEWIPVAVPAGEESVTVEGLAPETYEFRRPGDENHFASSPETITIQPGPKLTVTLPSPQTGYTLTADKVELSWHDSVTLTLTLETGYYRTASLAVKAGDRVFTEDNGTYTLTDVEENLVITLEGVEKDEKAPSLALQNWTFGKGAFQGIASPKDWKNISTATAPYYVISTRGNYFAVEAWDGETGLASVSYLLSRTALTREDLEQAAWESVPEESLNQVSPVREHMIQLGLGEWYFYVKAVDKAGNVSYVGSDKLIREENAPTFSGVTNGATYYTTQKVTVTDNYALSRYLPPLSRYWKDISGTSYEVTLEGNREETYTMKVEDACQNTGTITVYMKPISALTEDIRDLTEDNVCKSDLDQLNQAEKALKALDTTNATDEEKKEIAGALDNIGKLKTVLEEVTQLEAMIAALPESVEPWDAETEKRVLDTRSAYDAMTDHQKTMVDDSKLRTLEGQLVDYRFTSGENQTWALGCGKELRFTVNGQLAKVKEVRLNGKTVDPEKTAQAKGTDFALKAADLQGLKTGSYTLQVLFTDGQTPQTQFTVTVSPNYLDLSGYPEFDNEENVTVNGRTYPIGTDGGRYVNLPETGDILQRFTYLNGTYSAAHENYPTGMAAYRIIRQEGGAKLERIDGLDDLLIYSGCSIRISGKQGIRMITGITQDNKKALTSKAGLSGYTLEEYGTLICWNTDVTSGDDFSLDMSCARHNYAYLKGKADPVFARQDGKTLYTNVLVGFSLEDCGKDLILRPYIKLKDMTTGETVTLYGGSVCRSIGYIAKQNADTYKPGTAGYKYVHKIINAVYGKTEQGG